jgi:hypothetical protein
MQTSRVKDIKARSLRMLCGVAWAANELQSKHYLSVIRGMDVGAFNNYIEKVYPRMWSRHA